MHANLCMHILASTCQDGGNPFPVIRLPVVNSMTDSSRHTLQLPALHSQWLRQVYIIHRSITGFLVVQEPTCTHAHEYRLLGASCFLLDCLETLLFYTQFVWVIAWGRVKLRINIMRVFRNCRNCPSRAATRAISAISENTSDINP